MPELKYKLDPTTRVATFTIDATGPVNLIGQALLADLENATDRALDDQVVGVIICSAKPRSFLDGANLQEILAGGSRESIRHTVLRYQKALHTLAQAPFSVVAQLDGQTALGGGFELLLWSCDHVFASPGSKVGLVEINVGLFPAGGGTWTLARLVGFSQALQMIMAGRPVPADTLAGVGFVTGVSSGELRGAALEWIAAHGKVANRNCDDSCPEPDTLTVEEKKGLLEKARRRHCVSPHRPHIRAALDAIEAGIGQPVEAAAAGEIERFVPLFESANVRNKIDLFFMTTTLGPKLVKVNPRQAVKVEKAAVIGAGLMGQGIAQVAADRGVSVVLIDVDEKTARGAKENIGRSLGGLVEKGRWPAERPSGPSRWWACISSHRCP